jgi:uncharacterized protein (DUF362 family)
MNNLNISRVGISQTSNLLAYGNPDEIQHLVREALLSGGLGQKNLQVPLADIIPPGGVVLLKPNWVNHENCGGFEGDCLFTHPEVIKAVLREVVLALPSKVIIADAPIQDCNFNKVVPDEIKDEFNKIAGHIPIEVIDLRRAILADGKLSGGIHAELRHLDNYVLFNLKEDSLVENITSKKRKTFRIIKYDHRKLAEHHKVGKHEYLMAKEAFLVDTVISIPKLKTHKKAGITGALKNLVGLNGNKDYLPHHRVGGTFLGGDSYPGFWPLKRIAEFFLDTANKKIGDKTADEWVAWAYKSLRLHYRSIKRYDPIFEGSWHGNDTCWRMVGDLNRILRYGRPDGTLADAPQRVLHSITDAIVCGHGDGPLHPRPIFAGLITYSPDPYHAELVHCGILRLNADRIRMLRGLKDRMRWPISDFGQGIYFLNRIPISIPEIAKNLGVNADPAPGWDHFVEWNEFRG